MGQQKPTNERFMIWQFGLNFSVGWQSNSSSNSSNNNSNSNSNNTTHSLTHTHSHTRPPIMKIFATRKRKEATPEDLEKQKVEASKQRQMEHAAEIEKILEMKPEELNSKQRRMLKRHRSENDKHVAEETTVKADKEKQVVVVKKMEPAEDSSETKKEETKEEEKEDTNEKEAETNDEKEKEETKEEEKEETIQNVEISKEDEELMETIKGMNSKERRIVLRKLKREGKQDLVERLEVVISKHQEEKQEEEKKQEIVQQQEEEEKKKQEIVEPPRKKKKRVDDSLLSPEERHRRQCQREMQKEAAERRARGETTGHRHPLNSERRRANRRKPKWAKNEKHTSWNESGYNMRHRGHQPSY